MSFNKIEKILKEDDSNEKDINLDKLIRISTDNNINRNDNNNTSRQDRIDQAALLKLKADGMELCVNCPGCALNGPNKASWRPDEQ